MDKIISYISKKYGMLLTEAEAKIVVNWYEKNAGILKDEETIDSAMMEFLTSTFKNKELYLCAEDTSHMKYLLSLLLKSSSDNKDKTKK
jgi:hypothetical protein